MEYFTEYIDTHLKKENFNISSVPLLTFESPAMKTPLLQQEELFLLLLPAILCPWFSKGVTNSAVCLGPFAGMFLMLSDTQISFFPWVEKYIVPLQSESLQYCSSTLRCVREDTQNTCKGRHISNK
jgi:hypothetical protein